MTVQAPRSDHYATLGVPSDADTDEIARAYRRAVKEAHPDLGGDHERFQALQDAWHVLGDRGRRGDYDEHLRLEEGPPPTMAPPGGLAARRMPRVPTRRGATAMVGGGLALCILGIAAAVWTFELVSDTADFRRDSIAVSAEIVSGPTGNEVEFSTAAGEVVRAPQPEPENPGVLGDTVAVRYDRDDPTRVRLDESTTARDITVGIVAVKLLVGGPALVFVGRRRRRTFT